MAKHGVSAPDRSDEAPYSESEFKETDRETLLQELNKYVDELADKKGSDGERLLRVPSNFDAIVQSMNREDLVADTDGADEKPWSQYLLLDSLNAEEDGEDFEGRYKNLHMPDDSALKISKGLAKIKMLDRQLHEVVQRAASAGAPPAPPTREEGGLFSPSGDDVLRLHDGTFITKSKGINFDNTVEHSPRSQHQSASQRASPTSAAKAVKSTSKASVKTQAQAHRALTEEEQKRVADLLRDDHDASAADEEYLQFRQHVEQENKEIDAKLAEFGRLDRLKGPYDGSGAGGGGSSRLRMALAAGAELDANDPATPVTDYLAQQREEREERQYAMRLNALLQQCQSQVIDYRALVENDDEVDMGMDPPRTDSGCSDHGSRGSSGSSSSSSRGRPRRSRGRFSQPATPTSMLSARSNRSQRSTAQESNTSQTSRSHDVPTVAEVRPDSTVTGEDIRVLIESIVKAECGLLKNSGDSDCQQDSAGSSTATTVSATATTEFSISDRKVLALDWLQHVDSGSALESRDRIQAVLKGYSEQLQELQKVRQRHRIYSANRASRGSSRNSNNSSNNNSNNRIESFAVNRAGFGDAWVGIGAAGAISPMFERQDIPDKPSPQPKSITYIDSLTAHSDTTADIAMQEMEETMTLSNWREETAPSAEINLVHPAIQSGHTCIVTEPDLPPIPVAAGRMRKKPLREQLREEIDYNNVHSNSITAPAPAAPGTDTCSYPTEATVADWGYTHTSDGVRSDNKTAAVQRSSSAVQQHQHLYQQQQEQQQLGEETIFRIARKETAAASNISSRDIIGGNSGAGGGSGTRWGFGGVVEASRNSSSSRNSSRNSSSNSNSSSRDSELVSPFGAAAQKRAAKAKNVLESMSCTLAGAVVESTHRSTCSSSSSSSSSSSVGTKDVQRVVI